MDKVPGVISTTSGYMGGSRKNPVRYKFYVTGCGRYARLDDLWGKLRK